MRENDYRLKLILGICIVILLAGWRYSQGRVSSWEYKIVPINDVEQGERSLKELDANGWEFIAVQSLRTEAELVPTIRPVQIQTSPFSQQTFPLTPSEKAEAYYFFRRAKTR